MSLTEYPQKVILKMTENSILESTRSSLPEVSASALNYMNYMIEACFPQHLSKHYATVNDILTINFLNCARKMNRGRNAYFTSISRAPFVSYISESHTAHCKRIMILINRYIKFFDLSLSHLSINTRQNVAQAETNTIPGFN